MEKSEIIIEKKEEEKKPDIGKKSTITFLHNRSCELTIGRTTYFFLPYQSQTILTSELKHPDYIQQSEHFTIKSGGTI
mgnify:CR=1 FL=1